MAEWAVGPSELSLNVSLATSNSSNVAVHMPTITGFAQNVNASVVIIPSMWDSYCVEPMTFPPPPTILLPSPPPPTPPVPLPPLPSPPFSCGPGTYVDPNNPGACIACAAGTYSSDLGSVACTDCPTGSYCPAVGGGVGAVAAVPCPGGTYSQTVGITSEAECVDVAENFYAPLGSTNPIACPNGGQCPGRANDQTNAVAGEQPIFNLAAAPDGAVLSCPAGQKAIGAACGPCDKGHWCQGGIAQKCDKDTWNNVTNAGNATAGCLACPVPGTDCVLGDTITVQRGWYVHGASETQGYKCALAEACVGGDWQFGDLNCAEGYEGVLCGRCQQGFYRSQRRCASCEDAINAQASSGGGGGSPSANTALLMASMGAGTFLSLFFYLLPTSFRFDAPRSRVGKGCASLSRSTIIKLITNRLRRALPIFSGLAKVLLSYTQCIGALNRFSLVRWPKLFVEFMENLDVLVPEFLSVVPAECIAGTRFNFYFEFMVTLAMPLVLIGVIALGLLLVRTVGIQLGWPRAGKPKPGGAAAQAPVDPNEKVSQAAGDVRGARRALPPPETRGWRGFLLAFGHQNVFHLLIMAMLVMYPAIARKTMFLFDCMDGGYTSTGERLFLLRDDPATMCYDATWRFYSVFAWASVVIYCLGVPVAFLLLSYKYHRVAQAKLYGVHAPGDLVWLDRLALLVSTYEPKFWYCEALWMLHRFFFTGLVLILWPESRVQVWFGSVACLFVYVAFMLTRPFKYDIVDIVQAGCLLQLLLTYLTAFIFLDDGNAAVRAQLDDSPVLGVVLVAINCIAFIILFVTMAIETVRTRQAARSRRLRFVDNGAFVAPIDFCYALTPPSKKGGGKGVGEVLSYHIFLSHSWRTGQDAMRIVKEKLIEMVPGMVVFLDVDDLREGKGAESVDTSCVILVFCTRGYFSSSNCMRELLRAVAIGKPIVTVLEPDEAKGRLTRKEIFEQLAEADRWYAKWGLAEEVRQWAADGTCSDAFYRRLLPSAATMHQLLFDALFPSDVPPVEWDRIAAFQNISLCNIARTLLQPSQRVFLPAKGVTNIPKIPKPRMECKYHLYCSRGDPGGAAFCAALKAKYDALHGGGSGGGGGGGGGGKVDDGGNGGSDGGNGTSSAQKGGRGGKRKPQKGKELIRVTSEPSELKSCERMLLLLSAATWRGDDREALKTLTKDVASAMALGIEVFMVHEAPGDDSHADEDGNEMVAQAAAGGGVGSGGVGGRAACEFGLFFKQTPAPLLKAGLYSRIAKVAKGGLLRDASMQVLLHALAEFPQRVDPLVAEGVGLDPSVVPNLPELPPDEVSATVAPEDVAAGVAAEAVAGAGSVAVAGSSEEGAGAPGAPKAAPPAQATSPPPSAAPSPVDAPLVHAASVPAPSPAVANAVPSSTAPGGAVAPAAISMSAIPEASAMAADAQRGAAPSATNLDLRRMLRLSALTRGITDIMTPTGTSTSSDRPARPAVATLLAAEGHGAGNDPALSV